MQFSSHYTHFIREPDAVTALAEGMPDEAPDFIICYYTQEYNAAKLSAELKRKFPNAVIHGCSSCNGVMTEKGFHKGPVVSVLCVYDDSPLSAYGSALCHFPKTELVCESEVKALTDKTLEKAIKRADREGELPDLIILHATPGHEEYIVEQLESHLGENIRLIGGSAADNNAEKKWSVICDSECTSSGVSISVLYPSQPLETAFNSGYIPSEFKGVVTKATGRTLLEIDYKNASSVYKEWISAYTTQSQKMNDELTAQFPLGRVAGELYDRPYHKLSHPLKVSDKDGITLFSNIAVGDKIHLMTGAKDQLINRSSQVTLSAINSKPTDLNLYGGINIFCGGSMKIIIAEIDRVCQLTNKAYQGQPFICPFTFGEQGCFINGENAHGNLMLSSVVFYSDKMVQ